MRSHRNRSGPPSTWRFNMTPLIDVTFLLLTYFMLASHYASAEKPDMQVPQPDTSQALDRRFEDKITINLLYHEGSSEPELTFGPVVVGSTSELDKRLADLGRRNPQVEVILRADRRLKYGVVRKIMELIASHGLSRLQVVAELEEVP